MKIIMRQEKKKLLNHKHKLYNDIHQLKAGAI